MKPDDTVRSVDHTRQHTQRHSAQIWVNRHIQATVLDVAVNVGTIDRMVMDQLVVKATKDGWLALVKAHRGRRQLVAYVAGSTYGEALELAADFAEKGLLTWQADRWPPKILRRRKP